MAAGADTYPVIEAQSDEDAALAIEDANLLICLPSQPDSRVMFQTVEKMMRKAEALKLLTLHKPELIRRFGITDLLLFGSTARDEARPDSDIDVLARSFHKFA